MCYCSTLSKIEEIIGQINFSITSLDPDFVYFKDTHQHLRFDRTEAAFFNNIDYYYGLFEERGDIFKNFVLQKIQLYKLEYELVRINLSVICDLRTFKNHTLDQKKPHDKGIISRVEKWYFSQVGSKKPTAEQKLKCSLELNEMAYVVLKNILECLDRIKTDSKKEQLIRDMQIIANNYWPDYIIENKFQNTIDKMQIPVDAHILTKKYAADIRKKMQLYASVDLDQSNKNIELCIEELLFSNKLNICPLSGDTIMKEYGIKPGKLLGMLKKEAVEISSKNIFLTESEILLKLKELHPVSDIHDINT